MDYKKDTKFPSPTQEMLTSFDEFYHLKLPEDYKKFIVNYNGVVPESNVFNHENRDRIIERFLPWLFDPKEYGDIGWMDINVVISQIDTRLVDDEDLVGVNVIPFAVLFGGDFLCFDFRKNINSPSVVIWNHETSEELEPDLMYVCQDFQTLLGMLEM